MQYHTYAPGESQMHLRSFLQRLCVMAGLLRYLTSVWVEVDCAPSEVKANCDGEAVAMATEQNIISQIHKSKYLPVAD